MSGRGPSARGRAGTAAPGLPVLTDHRRGLTITFVGGLLLTIDIPLIRLAGTDVWTFMFVRGMMVFATLWLYWLWQTRARNRVMAFVNGMDGLAAGVLNALATVSFMTALYNTTAANLVFILAFNPMVSAIVSRIFLGERIGLATWATIAAAFTGVLIIVHDGLSAGSLFGDLMAFVTACLLAVSLTIMRHSGKDMSLMPASASLLSACLALFMAQPWTLNAVQWGWMSLNGILVMPLAMALMALGTRYISAPEVAMFFLLETVLTPVWIWLLFSESPSRASLAGGAIVITALTLHSVWRLCAGRQRPGRVRLAR